MSDLGYLAWLRSRPWREMQGRAVVEAAIAAQLQEHGHCCFCAFRRNPLHGGRSYHAENCELVQAGLIDRDGRRIAEGTSK